MSRRYRNPPAPALIITTREAFGHTERQAAELIGCDVSTWVGWERAKHSMPMYAFRLYEILAAEQRQPKKPPPLCARCREAA